MKYSDYLKTDEWDELRRRTKERDGYRCILCNSSEQLQVHHRTYERVGSESIDDLSTICDPCHDLFTAATKVKKPPIGEWVDIMPEPEYVAPKRIDMEEKIVYELLAFVLAFPDTRELIDAVGAWAYVLDPSLSEMVGHAAMGKLIDPDDKLAKMVSSYKSCGIENPERGVHELLAALKLRWIDREMALLDHAALAAKDAGDTEGRRGLIERILALRLEKDAIKKAVATGNHDGK